jgi:hypothetical protein
LWQPDGIRIMGRQILAGAISGEVVDDNGCDGYGAGLQTLQATVYPSSLHGIPGDYDAEDVHILNVYLNKK